MLIRVQTLIVNTAWKRRLPISEMHMRSSIRVPPSAAHAPAAAARQTWTDMPLTGISRTGVGRHAMGGSAPLAAVVPINSPDERCPLKPTLAVSPILGVALAAASQPSNAEHYRVPRVCFGRWAGSFSLMDGHGPDTRSSPTSWSGDSSHMRIMCIMLTSRSKRAADPTSPHGRPNSSLSSSSLACRSSRACSGRSDSISSVAAPALASRNTGGGKVAA
jgi:hypothetical protein